MLTFDDFRRKARDEKLRAFEKVGRAQIHVGPENKEKNIVPDVRDKLDIQPGGVICDIGCGCSTPARDLIDFARVNKNPLILIDSKEMLDQLPDESFLEKISCEFPICSDFIEEYKDGIDYVIVYSVIQIVFVHGNMFRFLDKAVSLLKNGGRLLLGDLPNITKKRRFLGSEAGRRLHMEWAKTAEPPKVEWNTFKEGEFDESVVFSILQRYRGMGCETYLLPQRDGLPMNKTREDILIVKW